MTLAVTAESSYEPCAGVGYARLVPSASARGFEPRTAKSLPPSRADQLYLRERVTSMYIPHMTNPTIMNTTKRLRTPDLHVSESYRRSVVALYRRCSGQRPPPARVAAETHIRHFVDSSSPAPAPLVTGRHRESTQTGLRAPIPTPIVTWRPSRPGQSEDASGV